MALYAVGDIQGCIDPLRRLLDLLCFDPGKDRLWFVGDLVNRGHQSAPVLRYIRELGDCATAVLGNHDLHLLAVEAGIRPLRARDTFTDVLDAPDREILIAWLRQRPLLWYDKSLNTLLVHAGVHPRWSLSLALSRASELQDTLRGDDYRKFLQEMYGDHPVRWAPDLGGTDRLRFVTNVLTRSRYVDRKGHLDFEHNGSPGTQPARLYPWFEVPGRPTRSVRVVFGHWSTLGSQPGRKVLAIDTGCAWGGRLTAVRLDPAPLRYIQVCCRAAQ